MFKLLIITHHVGGTGVAINTRIVEFATISARETAQRNILSAHVSMGVSVSSVAL